MEYHHHWRVQRNMACPNYVGARLLVSKLVKRGKKRKHSQKCGIPWTRTHLSSDFIVVEVHQRSGIIDCLPGVDEDPREPQAVLNVGAAAAPAPAVLRQPRLLAPVAAAVGQVAAAAGLGDGVGGTGRVDGVPEGGLSVAWRQ